MSAQKLNCFAFVPGKPMIYNKESALRFFKNCKAPFRIRIARPTDPAGFYYGDRVKTIEICYPRICSIVKQEIPGCDIAVDVEEWSINGEAACVNWIYFRRKAINARFKD